MPLIPRLLLTLFKAIWKNMLQIMLLVKHYLELFIAHWVFEHVPSSRPWPQKQSMVSMWFASMELGWLIMECIQFNVLRTKLIVRKCWHILWSLNRNLQDLGSCTILCYLPWSPWKQCCPPFCNSQSGLQPAPNTTAYVIIFSITWQATLKRESLLWHIGDRL